MFFFSIYKLIAVIFKFFLNVQLFYGTTVIIKKFPNSVPYSCTKAENNYSFIIKKNTIYYLIFTSVNFCKQKIISFLCI